MLRLRTTFHIASILCLLAVLPCGRAQKTPHRTTATANALSPRAARTAQALETARATGPLALYAFLYGMPKGGDLHNHLSGAIYAETFIRDAATDHLCIDVAARAIAHSVDRVRRPEPPHCDLPTDAQAEVKTVDGMFPAAALADNQPLYDALVDSFSMRSFVAGNGDSGHDHFFSTFDRFGGISPSHMPEWMDEVATRAAAQNEQYLELMHTPPFLAAAKLARNIGFSQDYAAYRDKMIAGGLRDQVPAIRSEMDGYVTTRRALEHCDTATPSAGCTVAIRFIYQVLRNFPPPIVFAQILLGFEVAAADPQHFLAINLVQPEDDFYAMRDYRMHMEMIAALRRFYPTVHVTLHAGELAPGLVEPEGLTFHIRDAVEVAGAERIGHGVDVMYEDRANALLREMATRHTMVEINLTSNDGILNVSGNRHPLPSYMAAGVPVALSTDDEGVNRSNMTHEYVRAIATYGIPYPAIKNMVRNSIEFSFLPGEPLWPVTAQAAMYRHAAAACGPPLAQLASSAITKPDAACAALLASSEKAAQQWDLERRFAVFEATEGDPVR